LFWVLTPCSLVGGHKSLSSLIFHTDVDEVAGLLEYFAVVTDKQSLSLKLDLEDKGTTIHQNIG